MTPVLRRRLLHGLAIGLAAGMLSGGFQAAGLLAPLERPAYDARARLLAEPGRADPRIVLVLVDQASLDFFADEQAIGWPWPRSLYAPLMRFARRAGARAVVFDVLFTELSVFGPEDDAVLGAALAERPDGVVAMALERRAAPAAGDPDGTAAARVAAPIAGALEARWPGAPDYNGAVLPVPEILAPAARLGNTGFVSAPAAVFRRLPLYSWLDGRPVFSLFAAAADLLEPEAGWRRRAGGLEFGPRRLAGVPDRGLLLRYRGGAGTYRSLSAAAVIQSWLLQEEGGEPTVDPAWLRDAVVFVGFSAPGLLDLRPTPLNRACPGVEIQATALDCLLRADFIRDLPLAWLWTGLAALAVAAGASLLPRARTQLLWLAGVLGTAEGLALAAYRAGFDAPQAGPLAGGLVAFIAASVASYAREGRQKAFIKRAFRQYLAPAVIEEILADPDRLKLGGERRELSLFFSDLEGFTGIGEALDPVELTALLNDYLSEMSAIIMDSGGTVDKYEGDAIIAFWNAPLAQPDHARRALQAAVDCQARLSELQPDYARRAGRPLRMRIGVNTGAVIVGNLGSRDRFDYSVLGDAANLASRLEGANKAFGSSIMAAESTVRAALASPGPPLRMRSLGKLRVKGRAAPVAVFEIAGSGPLGAAQAAAWAAFAGGLAHFAAGRFGPAAEVFEGCAGDPVARSYAARCRQLELDRPPDWDGVWVLEGK